MKKIIALLATVLLTAGVFAQAPQKMSYQAVVRNSSDQLVTDQAVGMQISILKGSSAGTLVYSEIQTPTTNANGLVTIEIGEETGFDTIHWEEGPYFIKTEIDPQGGTSYTITGTSQLLSVPYSLYAESVKNYSICTDVESLTVASTSTGFGDITLILQLTDVPAGTYAVYFSTPVRNEATSSIGINLVWAITTNDEEPAFPVWGIANSFIPATGWTSNYPFGQSGFKIVELDDTGTIEVKVAYYANITAGTVRIDGISSLTAIKIK